SFLRLCCRRKKAGLMLRLDYGCTVKMGTSLKLLIDLRSNTPYVTKQAKQSEWSEQWKMLQDDELFLFRDWIYPNTLGDFRGKTVLECGCGGGQHTSFVAPFAKSVTAVDLNTTDIARERNK